MNISAQDVLLALFNPEDTVCFRVFDDKKKGVFSGAKLEMEAGKYSAIEGTLMLHSQVGRRSDKGTVRKSGEPFDYRCKGNHSQLRRGTPLDI